MSPATASRVAAHARRLLTAKILSPHEYVVFDAMLWRLRRPGRTDTQVAYATIARLAGVCRDTAIESVKKLADIGLIQKVRQRVLVRWGRGRECSASRQIANLYLFNAPPTESTTPAADTGLESKEKERSGPNAAFEGVLQRLGATMGLTVPS